MATSIPTHNMSEVIDGVIAYMKNPDINTSEMLDIIKGPDFPTGGIVTNKDDLLSIYSTGMGKIKIRGKVEIEKLKGGKQAIVITEIPYTMLGANIGKFLNDVYSLVESKKTTDITDISNQSSKEGIRIVIELKKGADADNVCNLLYKKTRLEDTFGVNMLAVCDGRPETMGLVPIIRKNVDFQYELATRKYTTLLKKEREKKEIQEGLIKACDVIDLIIEILRGSKTVKDAKACLVEGDTSKVKFKTKTSEKDAKKLKFTERQAQAILDMRLAKLVGLEIQALMEDYEKTMSNIQKYSEILDKRSVMAKTIIKDLKEIKKEFGTPRKTVVDNVAEAVFEEKPIEEEDVAILLDKFGYARVIDIPTYERNKEAADKESRQIIITTNLSKLGIFTSEGNLHLIKILDLPFGKFRDKGVPIDNVSKFDISKENFLLVESIDNIRDKKLIFATKHGMIKIVDGSEFDVSKRTTAATKLGDDDEVLSVYIVSNGDTIVMQSKNNYFLRIDAMTVPEKKKGAVGVRGIRLGKDDELVKVHHIADGGNKIVSLKGKKISLNRLHIASRDTKGVKR